MPREIWNMPQTKQAEWPRDEVRIVALKKSVMQFYFSMSTKNVYSAQIFEGLNIAPTFTKITIIIAKRQK